MRRIVALLGSCALAVALAAGAPAPQVGASVVPCSNGLAALTFDDGPSEAVTPRLLDVLRERRVPAAFFVVGSRVDSTPWITRRTHRLGFTVANHTYRHERLTALSDAGIAATLRGTRRAIRDAGARPSALMRPPYGLINARVREVVYDVGLVPVMWDVDPRDWAGDGPDVIASRVLAQLRPHRRNIVLLHDGVRNSPNTLLAVPRIVAGARARGYCFGWLGPRGAVRPPVPRVSVADAQVTERDPGEPVLLRFVLRLSEPTSRATSVRVRTVPVHATAGTDYRSVDTRVDFPVGSTRRVVGVRVRGDRLDERVEALELRLDRPRGLRVRDGAGRGRILDDDPPPGLRLRDVAVTEPAAGENAQVAVPVRLSGPSERVIEVRVRTDPVTASAADYVTKDVVMRFWPGQTVKPFVVTVLGDDVEEPTEQLAVRATAVRNVRVVDGTATVTIAPAPTTPD